MTEYKGKINIIIAEDHALFLEAIVKVISKHDSINVEDTAVNGEDLLLKLENKAVDLVLLDIRMPIMDGISAAKVIKDKYPSIKIIMLTMHNHASMIKQMLQIGVHGYMLKDTDVDEIVRAMHKVFNGGTYYGEDVKDSLIDDVLDNAMENEIVLSENEKKILTLVCAGNSNEDIANQMEMERLIVDTYISNINTKTSTHNRKALIRFAYENNLIGY